MILAGENGVTKATDCFSERQGLDRSLEIASDLYNLDSGSQNGSSSPSVSPAAAAYVAYLTNLAQKSSNPDDESSSQQACLRSAFFLYPSADCTTCLIAGEDTCLMMAKWTYHVAASMQEIQCTNDSLSICMSSFAWCMGVQTQRKNCEAKLCSSAG